MNDKSSLLLDEGKLKNRFLQQVLLCSSVVLLFLCWGFWQDYQMNSVSSKVAVQIHSWRWAVSLGIVWFLVIYLFRRENRRMAEKVKLAGKLQTELEALSQESSRQKILFETIFDALPDAVVLTDDRERIVMANPAFTRLTGYAAEEVRNREVEFLLTPPDASLNGQDSPASEVIEMECKQKNGVSVTVEVMSIPVQNSGETAVRSVVVIRDLSTIKAAEKRCESQNSKLRRSYKMEAIGTLAGGIAHDFNNILGIILMNTDLLLDDIPEDNPTRVNIDRIVQASNRGRNLIEQILAYSRQKDRQLIPLMPGSFIKECLKFLETTIPASITIVRDVNDGFRPIMTDPAQLQELLVDLVSAAVEATNEKGSVEVTGTVVELDKRDVAGQQKITPGSYFRLSVKDSGTGTDDETQDQLLNHYCTTRAFPSGPSMNLAPIMNIVRNHGGHLALESEFGSGTTINVFFPIVEQDQNPAADDELPKGTEHVLFVDDEQKLIEMACMFLERQGFRVTEKTDSGEALETFKSKPDEFDIVVTDQTMPKMTGVELTVAIRRIRPDIPIILLSGYSKQISEKEIEKLGISKFLSKPFDGKAIVRAIRNVLDA